MSDGAPVSVSPLSKAGRHSKPVFSEKTFYLEEFYGKSLLFALIPPSGDHSRDLDSLLRTLRELRRNQTRCIVIVALRALGRLMARMARMAPAGVTPVFNPARGLRSRPYPPDSAVAKIWQGLRAGSIVVAAANTGDPGDFTVFARELATRLRVFKLVLLDRRGGITAKDGTRVSFAQMNRIDRLLRQTRSHPRRAIMRAARRALAGGVASVNLASPRDVYQELFSFLGAGTLFTEMQYGLVRPVSIDDFEEVEALILRGQSEGFLLPRNRDQIAAILPSCFGYRVGDEHLAGICSLLTEPYHRERAGEITALYTLTRFQGEGVAVQLVEQVLAEARARRLRYVFACTSARRAEHFFSRLNFRRVGSDQVAQAKWRGYERERIARLSIFRLDLT